MFLGYILYRVKFKNAFLILVPLVITSFYIIQSKLHYYEQNDHPIILWWTPFMGENERIIRCSSKFNCLLTKDRNYINNTNLQAVLFYGSKFELWDLPLPKKNLWALFHEESPRNAAVFLYNRTYELFEISATFSRHSDLPLTLQYLENTSMVTDTRYIIQLQEKNELLGKIAPVLYIQSDCDTPVNRDAYVNELMKYIQVDSFGACLHNKNFEKEIGDIDPLDLFNHKLLHFMAQYKFIIAFENGICDDYITEKLWRPLLVGSIPVYMGSPSVQDWLPNRNSAILARNFESPKQLAEYIEKINTDDIMYKTFLEHKKNNIENVLLKNTLAKGPYGITTDQEHLISAFECFVCEQIHDSSTKGTTFKNHITKSVYDCLPPNKGNGWEHYWQSGDCQSKALINAVKNNVKLEADPC